MTAFSFKQPDRIPRYDTFWEYPLSWQERFGPVEDLSDIVVWMPDEGAFPTRVQDLKEEGGWRYSVDSWGRTIRRKPGACLAETIAVPVPAGTDPDDVVFDPSDLDARYLRAGTDKETQTRLQQAKEIYCVFGKTGGPYLRTAFVRGEEQFLMDLASDVSLARALVEKMTDHLIGIAREQIKRWSLDDTGIWICDDMAYNNAPMFSPATFEEIFLPAYTRMIAAYKSAGAKYVVFHSDGNVMPFLDMLVSAGIDGLNPLEPRAGMNAAEIRRRYPGLVLIGGMCNSDTLINGPADKIASEARALIDLGQDGGMIIGAHSISPEVSLDHFAVYHHTCVEYGGYSNGH